VYFRREAPHDREHLADELGVERGRRFVEGASPRSMAGRAIATLLLSARELIR
jgi:hypothetical protein